MNRDRSTLRKRLLLVADDRNDTGRVEHMMALDLRNAGFEVVYLGGPLSSEAIETSAIQEGVDLICLAVAPNEKSSSPGSIYDIYEGAWSLGANI